MTTRARCRTHQTQGVPIRGQNWLSANWIPIVANTLRVPQKSYPEEGNLPKSGQISPFQVSNNIVEWVSKLKTHDQGH